MTAQAQGTAGGGAPTVELRLTDVNIAVLFVLAGLAGACGSNGGRDPDAGDATDDASEVFRNPFTVDIEGNGSVRAGDNLFTASIVASSTDSRSARRATVRQRCR